MTSTITTTLTYIKAESNSIDGVVISVRPLSTISHIEKSNNAVKGDYVEIGFIDGKQWELDVSGNRGELAIVNGVTPANNDDLLTTLQAFII